MKTLVIHPDDVSTEFLKEIYRDKGYTVETRWNAPMSTIRKLVRTHDRIMFMGHGGPSGLFGYTMHLNNPHFVKLLKKKETVCIWCNADKYVESVGLVGFYTGMFISEVGEASYFGIKKTQKEIDYSNNLFVQNFREVMDSPNILTEIKERYSGECEVIKYNNARLYYTKTPIVKSSEILVI
jgi:hypothetical protein